MEARIELQTESHASALQTWLIWACLVVILLMASLLVVRTVSEPVNIEGVVIYNRQPRGHDDNFVLPARDLPPVGGVHHQQFQNCGIYFTPIESEKGVHSLEHGAVWITYKPELPMADLTFLQEKIRGQEYLLLSPYPGQKSPVVLTAWGVQLEINSVHDGRIEEFFARYRLGPTTPERGAPCSGGFGKPLL